MTGQRGYLFGWWNPYPFQIWTPLPPEQAAVQLERSLVNRWRDVPGWGRTALRGSVVMGRFSLRPLDCFGRQQPTINGQIVPAPGSGSYVVGELSFGNNDKARGAVVPVVLIGVFGSCGVSMLVSFGSSTSTWITAVACTGMPTLIGLGVLRSLTIRTSTYLTRLRAHLCSVLGGVDVTAP
jgi:hypothetical protein